MKNQRIMLSAVLLVVVAGVFVLSDRSKITSSACGPYRSDKTIQIGSEKFAAEVADTPTARDRGLGGRPCIGPNQAMLFIFNKPSTYSMWMKDMKFPIDMIWVSASHKTVAVQRAVQPSTYPDSFLNKDTPALYIVELQANTSKRLNIGLNTPVNF